MNRTINRLKLVFLGLFALGCAGVWAYQLLWVIPGKRCEESGAWWDNQNRVCATPLAISSLTGRPNGVSRAEWSRRQAALMAQREREGVPAPAESAPAAPDAKPAAVSAATPAKKP